MNNIPSVHTFLDVIDPYEEVDRKRAFSDIALVTVLTVFKKASVYLDDDKKARVDELLESVDKSAILEIYSLFQSSGKMKELIKISEQVADEIKLDYIKTQLVALPREKRERVFTEFPALQILFED
jgi:hypothetical protein